MIFSHEEHGGSSIVLIFKSFPNFRGYKAYVLALLCWGLLAAQSVDAQEGYSIQNIEGWPVWVSDELKVKEPEATAVALDLLRDQCQLVVRVLPVAASAAVKKVPIWMSLPAPGRRPRAEFHGNVNWLLDNGMDPAKAKCVEFSNIPIFGREIKRMPMMLLHELAHAYHNLILGYDHPDVLRLYKRAKQYGSYKIVARRNHKLQMAYAMNNQMEYFAETTEAFFGENDFYPFNRAELKKHDPEMHELLKRLWENAGE
ncbi:MAG: hypothetical protein HN457_00065 [Opitutales bacterium]|nr:hypothetical protein [Opitutales bacterium]MBT5170532.1 hypothetical protein [Opitutales bacterium]MBT5812761.1 hypothetical protein [Opitutales bacterium]MBT6769574.1 hypothetical protein [Opitutales bacterium]MBT7864798.1 hypothetical protein [Opitutales bacterium]